MRDLLLLGGTSVQANLQTTGALSAATHPPANLDSFQERRSQRLTSRHSHTLRSSTQKSGVWQEATMIHINLIVLGKLKEIFWQEAEAEYLKRLQPWAKITIHELREESFSEKNNPEQIKQKEAEKILDQLKKFSLEQSHLIVLDEHGKQFSSINFSRQLDQLSSQQTNDFTFIIGGPLGLDQSILKLAKLKLSLSSMTFTHQMARVFLWEQIYRAMMINNGRNYHY